MWSEKKESRATPVPTRDFSVGGQRGSHEGGMVPLYKASAIRSRSWDIDASPIMSVKDRKGCFLVPLWLLRFISNLFCSKNTPHQQEPSGGVEVKTPSQPPADSSAPVLAASQSGGGGDDGGRFFQYLGMTGLQVGDRNSLTWVGEGVPTLLATLCRSKGSGTWGLIRTTA